jgi:hypothetical protein
VLRETRRAIHERDELAPITRWIGACRACGESARVSELRDGNIPPGAL